jgi:phosphoserine phosphatase
MSFRLILVHHGETAWSRERRFHGRRDSPLSSQGREQAAAVSRALASESPAAVYASPVACARETAQLIAEPHDLSVVADASFIELSFGIWEGLTVAEVRRTFPALYTRWRTEPHTVRFPGGEDLHAPRSRVRARLAELAPLYAGKTVVVVTHGVVVRLVVLEALDLPPDRLWAIAAEAGGITEIEYATSWATVHRMNARQHLELTLAP